MLELSGCCAAEALRERQRSVLLGVLGINLVMFVVELGAGWFASSTALLADSLDMLGDALVYGVSLYAVNGGALWKARAALLKGAVMGGFGMLVLAQAVYKLLVPEVPAAGVMGGVALLALAANAACLAMLTRHRGDDVNMRSVWICSRNDLIANGAVIGAGAAVWYAHSQLPDVIVGVAIAALFLRSAVTVIGDGHREASLAARA